MQIENHLNITVVFPDKDLPNNTNGGFKDQEEFRRYVHDHQKDGAWDAQTHIRPTTDRLADYQSENIVQAFPLLFPYGFSGMKSDPAVQAMSQLKGLKRCMGRNETDVLKKLLQHAEPNMHTPLFILIVSNILMKKKIFESCRMHGNCTTRDGQSTAEAIGAMTGAELERAIMANRNNDPTAHSSRTGSKYLYTIKATCRDLPHTNEAALEARKVYFSYLMKFGLPAIFLTVTPDDQRSVRISIYSGAKVEKQYGSVDVKSLSDEDLLAEFKVRQSIQVNHPGLCAEDYSRIIKLVIKHIFKWDEERRCSTGVGIFGKLEAWCLATEEQGRKTLHGHFLLFIKGWQQVLKDLQTKPTSQLIQSAQTYFDRICSATIFQDFQPANGELREASIFQHQCMRTSRNDTSRRMNPDPAPQQIIREMRHVSKCFDHVGKIGSCAICKHVFRISEVVTNAIQVHFDRNIQFPDKKYRLQRILYECQKQLDWYEGTEKDQALRLFLANVCVNLHSPFHSSRCFKGGKKECYANLPEQAFDKSTINYMDTSDTWYDAFGLEHERFMFRFYPRRGVEDSFANQHNPVLTQLLLCNTNVMCGLTGCAVLYITNYNSKNNQKEEKEQYERVSSHILKAILRNEAVSRNFHFETHDCSSNRNF